MAGRHLTTYPHTAMDRKRERSSFNIGKSVGLRVEWGAGRSQEALLVFPKGDGDEEARCPGKQQELLLSLLRPELWSDQASPQGNHLLPGPGLLGAVHLTQPRGKDSMCPNVCLVLV